MHRHRGVRVVDEDGVGDRRAPPRGRSWCGRPRGRSRRAGAGDRVPRADGRRHAACCRRRRRRDRTSGRLMAQRVSGLTRGTLHSAPGVCRDCVWWQSRGNRTASKERWTERVEDEWGEWGTIYLDDDGRFLGLMQYGASGLFPRAADLPAGTAVGRRRARHLRLPRPGGGGLGREVPAARGDRGVSRPGSGGARGVRLPLLRGRDRRGAIPHPPHRLPTRLPRRLRVQDAACPWSGGAVQAGARRAGAGGGGCARARPARRAGGLHAASADTDAPTVRQRARLESSLGIRAP